MRRRKCQRACQDRVDLSMVVEEEERRTPYGKSSTSSEDTMGENGEGDTAVSCG